MTDFDQLWDYDHPDDSERRFRDALRTSDNASASYRAQLLTQIARAQGLQRKFDEAHAMLDQVQSLLTDASDSDMTRARIRYLLERGRVLNSSGKGEESKPLFLTAYELGLASHDDFFAVDAAHMLGIVELPEQALGWNEKAVALAEQSSDAKVRGWLGSLLNNIGWTYHDTGRYDDALHIFERALQWREANRIRPQDDSSTRIAKWSVARALRSLNRVDEALEMQRELLAEWDHASGRDGYVHEELMECLLLLDQLAEARTHAALAYEELSKDAWLAENEPQRLRRLKELATA